MRLILRIIILGVMACAISCTTPKHPNELRIHHALDGTSTTYVALCEDFTLRNDREDTIGNIVCFSYLSSNAGTDRPVLFVFNGGPGSSSLWLHIGLGPYQVVLDPEVNPNLLPPYSYTENKNCLIDIADLVFVDPIGTGYSRIAGEGRTEDFYSIEGDAEILAQFIELWIDRHERWNSPKYLMGESYGSGRIALLARALTGGPVYPGKLRGVPVNGLIMLGTTLSDGTQADVEGAKEATARYHDKWPLDESLLHETDLTAFSKELLAEQEEIVGMYDSRYTVKAINPHVYDPVSADPSMSQYTPVFIGAFKEYLAKELNFMRKDRTYRVIDWKHVNMRWSWIRERTGPTFADDLAVAMQENQRLRVFIASGKYDMVTLASAVQEDLSKVKVDMSRITLKVYDSGHMLYIGTTEVEFQHDLRQFMTNKD